MELTNDQWLGMAEEEKTKWIEKDKNSRQPNYMSLPGTPQKGFDVFMQFDEDEPFKVDYVKHVYEIQVTGTPMPKVRVGEYTSSSIQFNHNGKSFKIFLKPTI